MDRVTGKRVGVKHDNKMRCFSAVVSRYAGADIIIHDENCQLP